MKHRRQAAHMIARIFKFAEITEITSIILKRNFLEWLEAAIYKAFNLKITKITELLKNI